MRNIYIIIITLVIGLSSQILMAQHWVAVNEGIPDLDYSTNTPPMAVYSSGSNIYIAYPIETYDYYVEVGIRKWNGSFWSDLPSLSFNLGSKNASSVNAKLIEYKNELYFAGKFSTCNEVPIENWLLKFNGNKWEAPGGGFPGVAKDQDLITSFEVYDNKLFISGIFDYYKTTDRFHLVIWDGTKYSTHDSLDFNGFVDEMYTIDSVLYFKGGGDSVSGKYNSGLSNWDGSKLKIVDSSFFNTNNKEYLYQSCLLNNKLYFVGYKGGKLSCYKYDNDSFTLVLNMDSLKNPHPGPVYNILDFYGFDNKLWIIYEDVNKKRNIYTQSGSYFKKHDTTSFTPGKFVSLKNKLYCIHGSYSSTLIDSPTTSAYNWISKYSKQSNLFKGRVYYDKNMNCQQDSNEVGIYDALLWFDTNFRFVPDKDGFYEIPFEDGNHVVSFDKGINKYKYFELENCFALQYNFNLNGGQLSDSNDFPLIPMPQLNDLNVQLIAYRGFRARQGFTDDYKIIVTNFGTSTVKNIRTTIHHPNTIEYISSNLTPINYTKTKGMWDIDSLKPQEKKVIKVKYRTSLNTNLNDTIPFYVNVTPILNDSNTVDNYDTLLQYVASSFDPNDKQSSPKGTVTKKTKAIKYQINFQNMGNDTAYKVVVIDTIDIKKLNLAKIYINSTSHKAKFEVKGNVFIWTFNNILLPDSGVNMAGSKGYIRYTAHINPHVNIGDSIRNKADIFFDYQKPVTTNYATVQMVDTASSIKPIVDVPDVRVYPNPANKKFLIDADNKLIRNVKVYNIQGQLIESYNNIENNLFVIQTENYNTGIYILEINFEDKTQYQKVQVIK